LDQFARELQAQREKREKLQLQDAETAKRDFELLDARLASLYPIAPK
jgi:hypothetical protein